MTQTATFHGPMPGLQRCDRRGRRPRLLALTLAAASLLLSACAGTIPTTGDVPLATVDLSRIYGDWYVIGTIPNFLERGVVESLDSFSPGNGAGHIREDYYARRGGFGSKQVHLGGDVIRVMPNTGNADWRVRPFWPFNLPFQVVYVDPDYRYVLFGEQDRNWGWVYSRTQIVSDEDYAMLMDKFRDLGWDTTRFRKVIQIPEQVGQPGFWNDGVRPQP